jgi:3-oxoacyl-[acyl-carrier protein] reductase
MMLRDKVAVIYGGGGAIGGSVARAFAREGAEVFLAGRTRSKLDAVAADIAASGGKARVAIVDALDKAEITRHADDVVATAGRIDIALNAVGFFNVHGTPLTELSLADFERPIHGYARTHFLTAKAVARSMIDKGRGVILTVSTPGARLAYPKLVGFGTACAAIEGLTRQLAADLGEFGVRVVCLRPEALPEALALGSHSKKVFEPAAKSAGIAVEEMFAHGHPTALLKRFPTLAEVAGTAAFIASDQAGAMTGTVVNLSCGSVVD